MITKKVSLYVEENGSNYINKCRSLSYSSADIWTRGTESNFFYSGGGVGIGVKNPDGNLEVDNSSHTTICLNGSCEKPLGTITPTIYSKSATASYIWGFQFHAVLVESYYWAVVTILVFDKMGGPLHRFGR